MKNIFKILLRPPGAIAEKFGKLSATFLEEMNKELLIKLLWIMTYPETITITFNSYYNSLPGILSDSIIDNNIPLSSYLVNVISEQQIFSLTNKNEINHIVKDWKNSTSYGWDCISTNVIKASLEAFVAPLTQLINKSLTQGIFPDALKIAKISTIYKNKSKTDVKNYRLISVRPVLSKIYEKVFYSRLYSDFVSNNLLTQNQYGFQIGKNTEQTLIKFSGDIIDGFDREGTVVTSMDLSKAFDCDILLASLVQYGVGATAINWIKS